MKIVGRGLWIKIGRGYTVSVVEIKKITKKAKNELDFCWLTKKNPMRKKTVGLFCFFALEKIRRSKNIVSYGSLYSFFGWGGDFLFDVSLTSKIKGFSFVNFNRKIFKLFQ